MIIKLSIKPMLRCLFETTIILYKAKQNEINYEVKFSINPILKDKIKKIQKEKLIKKT